MILNVNGKPFVCLKEFEHKIFHTTAYEGIYKNKIIRVAKHTEKSMWSAIFRTRNTFLNDYSLIKIL